MDQALVKRLTELQAFVFNLNSKFISSQYINTQLVTPDMLIKFWNPVFTHITANPSNGQNYELLEYVGDSILDGEFAEFLSNKLPTGSELLFTEISNAYTKNEYLSKVSDSLGMPSLLLTKGMEEIDARIKADLVEAYIGALVKSGNSIPIGDKISRGLGYSLSANFVNYIFGSIELDIDKGRGAPKTNVEQIFTRFGVGKPEASTRKEGSMMISEVYLKESQLDFLVSARIKISSDKRQLLIGTGKAREKGPAEAQAFENALNYLDGLGVNPRWADDLKNAKEMGAIPREIRDRAFNKAKKNGYVSMYFMAPGKASTPDGFTMMLIGVYENGTRDTLLAKYYPLGVIRGSSSAENAKARLDIITEYSRS